MLRISLRSVLSHKLRLALTAAAVVLGVAFASGMLMLTNALDRTFLDIFEGSAQDVVVTPRPAVEDAVDGPGGGQPPLLLDERLVGQLASLPGVAAAAGRISADGAAVLDADGELVGAVGPPALGVDWTADERLRPATIVEGRAPVDPDDVVIDELTYGKLGIAIGEPVSVVTPQGLREATLVGTLRFGQTGGLAGATITAFRPDTAQALFAEPGSWQAITLATADGYTDEQVAAAAAEELGDRYLVQTRAEQVEASAGALREGLSFINAILLGFAGIALFVAAFLIYNTFSMLIAARGREMALLRAVGATRRQVLSSVLLEAVLLGAVSGAAGVAVGYGLARLLQAGVTALGLDLTAGVSPTPAAIAVALLLGLTVTVASAVVPALRASRIRPVEALRQASAPAERPSTAVTALGAVVLAGAAALLVPALVTEEPDLGRTAIGTLVLLLAGILLAPVLAVLAARIATPVLAALDGVAGRIAGRSTGRSPRRVAATASALIVGLALVSGVTVVVASAQRSIEVLIDRAFSAELVIASTRTGQSFPASIGDEIAGIDGVRWVVRGATGSAALDGDPLAVTALGGGPVDAVFGITALQGDLAAFGPGSALVGSDLADRWGLSVGDTAALLFPSGREAAPRVAAVFEPSPLLSGMVVSLDDFRGAGGSQQDSLLFVDLQPDADPAVVVPQVEAAAAADPLLQVADQTEVKEQNSAVLDQLLYLIYAMLGLSIIIAALGVVNTMVLSVVERTREIGMLRAVGAERRQVRRMIRWEAVLVALLGGATGVALGVVAAIGLQHALEPSGISELVIPAGTIAVLLGAALLIGVLGAAFPARRAARLNILAAIATE